MTTDCGPTIYWLDANDCIERVASETWDAFAAANKGDAALSDRIVGRPLREFISGDSTQMWVNALIAYARLLDKPVRRDYRCDSPTEKRYMSMEITPLEDERLRVENRLLRTEDLGGELNFVTAGADGERFTQRCSICNKLRVHDVWVEPHPTALEQEASERAPIPVIYTVCSSCRDALHTQPQYTASS
ncbi:MAG: hypothetical protein AAGE01_01770 [Pseudomonadota bacterium]